PACHPPRRSDGHGRPGRVLHTAHRTEVRVVSYRWHPLAGREVTVRLGDRYRRGLRCQTAEQPDRYVFVPAWMFDAPRCARMRIDPKPHVSLVALVALRHLLDDTRSASGVDSPRVSTAPPPHEEERAGSAIGAAGDPRPADAAAVERAGGDGTRGR